MNRKKLSGTINDYQPIFIKCSDWLNTSEWLPVNKAQKIEPARCFTIGWKIKTHKKKITIFSSYSEDEVGLEVGGIDTIPKSWVMEAWEVIITDKKVKL